MSSVLAPSNGINTPNKAQATPVKASPAPIPAAVSENINNINNTENVENANVVVNTNINANTATENTATAEASAPAGIIGVNANIGTFLEPLKSLDANWSDRLEALRQLKDFLAAAGNKCPEDARVQLRESLTIQLQDMRSSIVKEACAIITHAVVASAVAETDMLSGYVAPLAHLVYTPIASIAAAASTALDAVFDAPKQQFSAEAIKAVVDCIDSTNTTVREKGITLLIKFLSGAGATDVVPVKAAVHKALMGAMQAGVAEAESAWACFIKLFPQFAHISTPKKTPSRKMSSSAVSRTPKAATPGVPPVAPSPAAAAPQASSNASVIARARALVGKKSTEETAAPAAAAAAVESSSSSSSIPAAAPKTPEKDNNNANSEEEFHDASDATPKAGSGGVLEADDEISFKQPAVPVPLSEQETPVQKKKQQPTMRESPFKRAAQSPMRKTYSEDEIAEIRRTAIRQASGEAAILALEVDELQQKLDREVGQRSELESLVKEFETTINKLVADNESMKSTYASTQQQEQSEKAALLAHVAGLEKDYEVVHSRYQDLKRSNAATAQNEAILRHKLLETENALAQSEEKYKTMRKAAEDKMNTVASTIATMRKTEKDTTEELTALKKAHESLTAEHTTASTALAEATAAKASAEKKHSVISKEYQDLKDSFDQTQGKIKMLEAQDAFFTTKNAELERLLADAQEQLSKKKEQNYALAADAERLEQLQAEYKEVEAANKKLNDESSRLKIQVYDQTQTIDGLKKTIESVQGGGDLLAAAPGGADTAALEQEMEALRKQLAAKETENRELCDLCDNLVSRLEASGAQ